LRNKRPKTDGRRQITQTNLCPTTGADENVRGRGALGGGWSPYSIAITPNMKRDREAHARGKKQEERGLTASANEPPIDESLIAWHRNADIAYKLPRYRA